LIFSIFSIGLFSPENIMILSEYILSIYIIDISCQPWLKGREKHRREEETRSWLSLRCWTFRPGNYGCLCRRRGLEVQSPAYVPPDEVRKQPASCCISTLPLCATRHHCGRQRPSTEETGPSPSARPDIIAGGSDPPQRRLDGARQCENCWEEVGGFNPHLMSSTP